MPDEITEKLVTDAPGQAIGRGNPPEDLSLVFHDDQGGRLAKTAQFPLRGLLSFRCEFCSVPIEHKQCLESHGIARSTSRPGNPWGNALAESFFKTLKREPVNDRDYKTREEASRDIFKYIELYYNRRRTHSSIGHIAPCDLECDTP